VPPEPGYYTFYTRQEFTLPDPATLTNPFLNIRYDDAYIAYLNGVEIARANITGEMPTHTQPADSTGGNVDNSGISGAVDLTPHLALLQEGTNILAIEIHNAGLTSSDAAVLAEISDFPDSPYSAIRGVRQLQQLIHLRGIYSTRQLQAVLGEFWENHFTTDFDKVEDYLLDLDAFETAAAASDLAEDRIRLQAEIEAAYIEWEEYEFFYDNALGYFGDLLLYSASSPAMLIYLDNVLNVAGAPNENYSREIFELSSFGVDNGYTQTDIEQLAKCFTGWTIRKVHATQKLPFPASARTPPTDDSITVATETTVLDLGGAWRYFKGTTEPSPGTGGSATTLWTTIGFDDSDPLLWLAGTTGIGYADGDDATVLTDMQQNLSATPPVPGYASVYLRHEFTLDPSSFEALRLAVDYDDGFIAYLNGTEIARSNTMGGTGTPPAYDSLANFSREAGTDEIFDLGPHAALFNTPPAINILAIQVHNTNLTSSDLSMRPRILSQTFTAESIDPVDPNGVWTFRFDPAQHNLDAKTLFAGSPQQLSIPADRSGPAGVNDAIDVIDAMAAHPSAAQFICIKLVNRFVSDEISLDTYQNSSAPAHLLEVMDNAIAAWDSTTPTGHIGTVMRAILDLDQLTGAFWMEASRANKIKNPIEFINSAYRALDANTANDNLPNRSRAMGMTLFQRDDPDGFDELGIFWTDTQSLLERMRFSQGLGANAGFSSGDWDIDAWLAAYALGTGQQILDHFDTVLFASSLSAERRAVITAFMDSDINGAPSPIDSLSGNALTNRIEATVGVILSLPEFQYQ